MRALPILETKRAALETCAFCPKLCRSACPVSNAEPRETITPWGKMTAAYMTALGDSPLSASFANPAWACTACGACSKACDHENDVASTLTAARHALSAKNLMHPAAARVVATFSEHAGQTAKAASALASDKNSKTALLVGCTYLRRAPKEAADAVRAANTLLGPVDVVQECCGLPLILAGDRDRFAAHAKDVSDRLAGKRVVVVDPGCAVALRKHYPEAGVVIRNETSLLLSEAAARLDELHSAPRATKVRYHDPCQLGRGLGIYAEPRSILTRILRRAPEELPKTREHGTCSGAGGLLPVTMPEVSQKIAETRWADHEASGGGEIVTACASSLLSLRRTAKKGERVSDLVTWIANALER